MATSLFRNTCVVKPYARVLLSFLFSLYVGVCAWTRFNPKLWGMHNTTTYADTQAYVNRFGFHGLSSCWQSITCTRCLRRLLYSSFLYVFRKICFLLGSWVADIKYLWFNSLLLCFSLRTALSCFSLGELVFESRSSSFSSIGFWYCFLPSIFLYNQFLNELMAFHSENCYMMFWLEKQ